MSRFSNILLVQLGDIGDVVLTTPTICAVKENYPEARVSILVYKPFGSFLVADPNLHEVIEAVRIRGTSVRALLEHLRFARRLRQSRYDLVIDLRTSDRGAILSFITGAQERVGRRMDNKPFWYSLIFTKLLIDPPYAHLPVHPGADQSLRIVRAIGIDTHNSLPKLFVSPKDRVHAIELLAEYGLTPASRWVTINPCSRWKYKEWGYKKWGGVIDLLWQNHRLATVLIGSPEDASTTEQIAAGRNDHTFNLAGKTTLGELSALLAMSSLHLGVDSAAPHIAAAVGTPTLTIFGPGNWKSWTVTDDLHQVVTSNLPCVPCNRKGCDDSGISRCLDELATDRVYAQASAILSLLDLNHSGGCPANLG
jgi:heptosyltransferase-3